MNHNFAGHGAEGAAFTRSDSGSGSRQVIIATAVILPTLVLIAIGLQPWVPPAYATRDPLAVAAFLHGEGLPCCSRFLGAVSTLGVMTWCATGAVCMLATMVLANLGAERRRIVVLALASVLSFWLMTDDAFMLHEGYGGKIFGVIEPFQMVPVLASVPLVVLLFLTRGLRLIFVLAAAFVFLGGSLVIDDFLDQSDGIIFYEDGLKLYGISFWAAYFLLTALEMVAETCRAGAART